MNRPDAPGRGRVARAPFTVLALLCASAMPVDAQTAPDDLVFRRIWTSSAAQGGLPLVAPAEGRYLAISDSTGDLALYDLQTERLERITHVSPSRRWQEFLTGSALISADGRRIAYLWANIEGEGGQNELRVIGRDGTGERVLVSGPMPSWIEPRAWTPDGSAIIAQRRGDGMVSMSDVELVRISTIDGSTRALARFESGNLGSLFVSPDGRYAAYDFLPIGSADADIYVVALDGGAPRALIRGNGNDQLMGWAPDGSGIFFYSNRELRRAIWKLRVTDGQGAGEPVMVRADVWGLAPMGFSGDRFYYTVVLESPQVRTATLDFDAGRVVTPPAVIREPSERWSRDPAWSPDGRYLAFLDYPVGVPWVAAQARLGIRSAHTGETQYLAFPFPRGARLFWTPDAGSLLVIGLHDGVAGIHRLDLETGDVTLLRERPEQGPESSLALSPDGSTYYFHRDRSEIWAGDVVTGRERLLARVDRVRRRIGVSPDGRMLVMRTGDFHEETRLVTLPASGGEPREIYRGDVLRGGSSFLEITPDNRYVIAASFAPRQGIWRFAIDGSSAPLMILEGEAPRSFNMNADGRRIAYWDWADPENYSEVWVIEGLTGGSGGR